MGEEIGARAYETGKMRVHHAIFAVVLGAATAGCHSASSPPASSGTSAQTCGLSTVGPLIGYSHRTTPLPVASGGAIPDGTYDLVQMVDHLRETDPRRSNEAPALRMAFRFTTEERSPNHTEGSLDAAVDVPPAQRCERGRFATVGQELRGLRARNNELSSTAYSATPDGFILLFEHGAYVFRRRS